MPYKPFLWYTRVLNGQEVKVVAEYDEPQIAQIYVRRALGNASGKAIVGPIRVRVEKTAKP